MCIVGHITSIIHIHIFCKHVINCSRMCIMEIIWPTIHIMFSYISFFPSIYVHELFLNGADSEKSVSYKCPYVTKSPGSDQTPPRTRDVWWEPGLFVPPGRFSQMTSHNYTEHCYPQSRTNSEQPHIKVSTLTRAGFPHSISVGGVYCAFRTY